jgi:hypothetical protein
MQPRHHYRSPHSSRRAHGLSIHPRKGGGARLTSHRVALEIEVMRITASRRFEIALVVILLAGATAIHAQDHVQLLRERAPKHRPALLVLGTAHFSNPGRDVVNLTVEDVLSVRRQAEIETVVSELVTFHPTHIAVEWPRKKQEALNTRYDDYRQHRYQLSNSEEDQLGLRLAARLSLARVYAVDWNEDAPGEESQYDWDAYAKSHGEQALLAALFDPSRTLGIVPLGTQSIASWLLAMNRPDVITASHRNYFDIALIGDEAQQPGAAWVGAWYARNLRIFNNILQLTDRPQDRILVIYGQGHAYLLRRFAIESGAFRLMEVDAVLKP